MLDKDKLRQETNNAINWIKEYVNNCNAKGIVVGNSGGKDSAVVIAMSTKAIGKENVLAVSMPCFSNNDDLEDARLVANEFRCKYLKN